MSLSSVSIRRPVLATVLSLVILLFGFIGMTYLGVREYPSVDPPNISVTTSYAGASADVVESQITEPLEEVINGIAGIRSMTSTSRDGRSTIQVEFELEIDLEAAANDVRDKVAQAIQRLPPDADPPVVSKANADAFPIIFLNIKSDKRSMLELTDIAERTFKERLQTIPGVSEIRIWGSKKYSMRLWIDPNRLSAHGLTPLDVRDALLKQNVELPSGSIEGANTEFTIRTLGRLESVDDFNNMIIRQDGNKTIYFRDIGTAELGPENLRTVLKREGVPMVGNAIVPQPGSNHIEIADEFYRRLEQIKKDLPPDIELGIGFDTTRFIRESIKEVEQTVYIAFILVVLVIFFFLRNWRTTFIPMIVIPISLIGAFFIMYIAGFSINVLTLLGIVLAIGLVVDDAIVVLENIYAKIEKGLNPVEAGLQGSAEIFFAVIATTLSLAAVFLPVIFLQGIVGRLFREFGIVLAGAVIISSFVALTLTPMLSSKILKKSSGNNFFYNLTEPFFIRLTNGYSIILQRFMKVRWVAFPLIAVAGWLIFILFKQLPSELAPLEDRGNLRMVVTGQEGATFEYMDRFMDQMIKLVKEDLPEHDAIITVTSPGFGASSSVNSGFMRLSLQPRESRARSQQEVAEYLGNRAKEYTGARVFITQEPTIGDRRSGLPVQYVIQASTIDRLKDVVPKFVEKAAANPAFKVVDVNLKFSKPEISLSIDRAKAQSMGVSVADIAQTLQLAFSGQRFGFFVMDGKQYQVIGQADRSFRDSPSDIGSLTVRTSSGDLVQLDNFVTIRESSMPPQLFRYNRFASATVSAGLNPGYTIGDGINIMDEISKNVLPDNFSTALSGESRDFQESSSSLMFAFLLALVLVYLVLAAQFESFRDPLIIMFTVPLAILGALGTLWLFGQSLNIFSQIGIIMLVGLVTKNGILMVEFANQRKATGLTKREAITDAAIARFRPILMTSISTILGTMPIALALGAGSESRISMGLAIVGGLTFATLLTLLVVPAVYSFISEEKKSVTNVEFV